MNNVNESKSRGRKSEGEDCLWTIKRWLKGIERNWTQIIFKKVRMIGINCELDKDKMG